MSDNLIPASLEWKQRMIRCASEEFNLNVFGEVGKKEGLENIVPLVDNAKACLDASASIIIMEAAELVSEDVKTSQEVEEVVKEIGIDKIMFELPGPWIPGVTSDVVNRMRRELVEKYGVEVAIGNVLPEDLMFLEAFHRGLDVNAGESDRLE